MLNALKDSPSIQIENPNLIRYDVEYQKDQELYKFLIEIIQTMDFKEPCRSICRIHIDVSGRMLHIFVKRGN